MSYVGAAIGTIFGMLVAGVLHKLFPGQDLTVVLASIVAVGCIAGVAIEWHSTFVKRKD